MPAQTDKQFVDKHANTCRFSTALRTEIKHFLSYSVTAAPLIAASLVVSGLIE